MVPGKFSWLDGKGKLGPTDGDFTALQSTSILPTSPSLGLSAEEAYSLAEKALKDHFRREITCIKNKPVGTMTARHRRILPFQVFNELDSEYFRSVLKGNVSLDWSELPSGIFSRTSRAGHKRNPRIRIELSPSLRYGGRLEIFAALIHQMVHAYYLQCCGKRDQGFTGAGHGLEHEQPFLALLKIIGEHCEPLQKTLAEPLWAPRGGNRGYSGSGPTAGVSFCYVRNDHYKPVDIQEWRDTAVATAESLQEPQTSKSTRQSKDDRSLPRNLYFVDRDGTENPPKALGDLQYPHEAYIFLCFDNRCYPVARSSVADLAALTASPYFKEKLWLQLPQGTSEADFLAFYLFLAHGAYPPMFKDLNAASTSVELTSQGPPKIKPYDANAAVPVASLIAAFKLGKALRYAPFCEFVLKGLRSQRTTAENPMVVLEKIYSSQKTLDQSTASTPTESPDPQLSEWARAWLAVKLLSAEMGRHEACYQTNLGLLRHHPEWSANPLLSADDESAQNTIVLRNGGDSRILRPGMPVPAQQPPLSPDIQHSPSLQHRFDMPRPISFPKNRLPRPHNGALPYYPGRSNDDSDLAALFDQLRLHGYPPILADRSTPASGIPVYPESLLSHEVLQFVQEQALRESQGAHRPEIPPDVRYQQAFPGLGFLPRGNLGSGN
ncbi:MAG: hypothetical protein LQ343_005627 [Gyalolechia ehrenbergii]|nr:MAG: hypothetical protein LQ343_005627 [Gyalolechia ehrenbergii]